MTGLKKTSETPYHGFLKAWVNSSISLMSNVLVVTDEMIPCRLVPTKTETLLISALSLKYVDAADDPCSSSVIPAI